jgi:NAD(P)-dependent dehydrogenase (short-subunit alcohol dehydrogenase family)
MRDDGPNAGVAVVTGASRGAGRGIAIALGAHGYTVYVTGRTQRVGESPWGGTIHDTAAAVTGHVVAALAADPDVLAVSGRTLIGAEVALQYGITDRDGRHPPSMRELMSVQPVNYQGKTER